MTALSARLARGARVIPGPTAILAKLIFRSSRTGPPRWPTGPGSFYAAAGSANSASLSPDRPPPMRPAREPPVATPSTTPRATLLLADTIRIAGICAPSIVRLDSAWSGPAGSGDRRALGSLDARLAPHGWRAPGQSLAPPPCPAASACLDYPGVNHDGRHGGSSPCRLLRSGPCPPGPYAQRDHRNPHPGPTVIPDDPASAAEPNLHGHPAPAPGAAGGARPAPAAGLRDLRAGGQVSAVPRQVGRGGHQARGHQDLRRSREDPVPHEP